MPRKPKKPQVKVKVVTEWMSAEEAREYLRLSTTYALYQLARRGHVPAYRLGKRSLIFSRSQLDAHIRANVIKPKPAGRKKPKPS